MIAISKRERILLYLALGTVGLLLLDRIWLRWVRAAWAESADALLRAETQLIKARRLLDNRERIENRWAPMKRQIERAKKEKAASFLAHLSKVEQQAHIAEKSRKPLRAEERDGYRVEAFRIQFRCSVEQLARFLEALDNSERFVRVGTLRITGSRAGDLDVLMEVSTLVFPQQTVERAAS